MAPSPGNWGADRRRRATWARPWPEIRFPSSSLVTGCWPPAARSVAFRLREARRPSFGCSAWRASRSARRKMAKGPSAFERRNKVQVDESDVRRNTAARLMTCTTGAPQVPPVGSYAAEQRPLLLLDIRQQRLHPVQGARFVLGSDDGDDTA